MRKGKRDWSDHREPMTDRYLLPRTIVGRFNRHHPDASKQVDQFSARRKNSGTARLVLPTSP
jgi:hypothetical protein